MASFSVYPCRVGFCDSAEPRLFYLGDCGKSVPTVFLFWLLKSPERIVLVDTGFSPELAAQYMPDVVQQPDEHPHKHLERYGVRPDDINLVVATHAHFDHLSDIVLGYPYAKVVLQRREYEFVTNPPHPWFGQMVDHETLRTLKAAGPSRFELLDGDGDVVPGISVITTPGHTAGHQSVLVDTARGKAVITADACFTYRHLEEDIGPGFNCSLIDALASLQRIRDTGAIVLPGHDPAIFEKYPKMPIL